MNIKIMMLSIVIDWLWFGCFGFVLRGVVLLFVECFILDFILVFDNLFCVLFFVLIMVRFGVVNFVFFSIFFVDIVME